tara:strand:- start:10061 stop:10741 length:681 start_codon:yes stop_codon:yes gene_type:complete
LFSQTCSLDGKSVVPVSSTEIVNNESLALYRCSNGHQMWLTNPETKVSNDLLIKSIGSNNKSIAPINRQVAKYKVSNSELKVSNPTVSKGFLKKTIDSQNKNTKTLFDNLNVAPKNKNVDSLVFTAVKKRETMSKKESQRLKFSSSLNIQKFGLETLLHKKIESDRQYSEKLDNEKSELLHLMYTQKMLFDKIDNNKFSFKKYTIFSYSNLMYLAISIAFTSYLIF